MKEDAKMEQETKHANTDLLSKAKYKAKYSRHLVF